MSGRILRSLLVVTTLLATMALAGCPEPKEPCDPPTLKDESVVISNVALLESGFSLRRTLQAIIDTSGGAERTPEEMLKGFLADFRRNAFTQGFSGKVLPVDVRSGEAGLDPSALLDTDNPQSMIPIGLFNRFDLAPGDASDCGEYRIVYGRPQGGRFFLIFESKLRNPNPRQGLDGCKAVNDLWVSLSQIPEEEAVERLEEFYYTGLEGFDPVVAHRNYGLPLGQIRSNLFVRGPWQLREHRTALDGEGRPVIVPEPAKDAPLTEWFGPSGNLPGTVTAADQQAYRATFVQSVIPNLVRPELDGSTDSPNSVINSIGAGSPVEGDEFQSNSQSNIDDPRSNLEEELNVAVDARLRELGVDVTPTQAIDRMGAMTCAGCHRFSAGRDMGSGARWPSDRGFVHIDERGGLSAALTNVFIPRRKEIVSQFACPTPSGPQTDEVGPSVDYGAIDELVQAYLDSVSEKKQTDAQLNELNRAIDEARRLDRELPGAFVSVRRTH